MVEFASWLRDWGALVIAGLAVGVSLALGVPAFVRAGRAEGRAERAEDRADRMEARDTERHHVTWGVRFREDDATYVELLNLGADDAHDVLMVVAVNDWKVYHEEPFVMGREAQVVAIHFPLIRGELERVAAESRALSAGSGFELELPLPVSVSVRFEWRTALGSPRSEALSANFNVGGT